MTEYLDISDLKDLNNIDFIESRGLDAIVEYNNGTQYVIEDDVEAIVSLLEVNRIIYTIIFKDLDGNILDNIDEYMANEGAKFKILVN